MIEMLFLDIYTKCTKFELNSTNSKIFTYRNSKILKFNALLLNIL